MTTVLIADDQPMQRFGFRMLLESQDDMTVVGEAGNGTEAINLIARHQPDVTLMDIRMPGLDGIEATAASSGRAPAPASSSSRPSTSTSTRTTASAPEPAASWSRTPCRRSCFRASARSPPATPWSPPP